MDATPRKPDLSRGRRLYTLVLDYHSPEFCDKSCDDCGFTQVTVRTYDPNLVPEMRSGFAYLCGDCAYERKVHAEAGLPIQVLGYKLPVIELVPVVVPTLVIEEVGLQMELDLDAPFAVSTGGIRMLSIIRELPPHDEPLAAIYHDPTQVEIRLIA